MALGDGHPAVSILGNSLEVMLLPHVCFILLCLIYFTEAGMSIAIMIAVVDHCF